MTTPAYRLLGSGRRRRLGDGRVRSVGAPVPRYTDIGGATGVGVGAGGQSSAWVPLAGEGVLTFSLTADLDSAGVIGRATLAVAVAGRLSATVNVVAATALGFATAGRLTGLAPIAGAIPVSVQIGGALTGAASLAGGTVARIRVQAVIGSPTSIRGAAAVGIGVTGTLSTAASGRWRDLWREAYDKRQALLNAIDANNRYLAQQAGDAAQAAAAAVVATNTRVDAVDGRITAEANRITALTTRVTNTENTNTAQGNAISALQTTVTNQGNTLTSHSSQLTGLSASVTTLGGRVTNVANATELLKVEVSSLGAAKAIKGLYLNVNGHISGYQSINDGTVAQFSVMADVFRVLSPGSVEGMEWRDGYLRAYRTNTQAIIGNGFGPDALTWFIGPNVGPRNASKANASIWADGSGNVGMTGLLKSSLLSASAFTLDSTRIFTGGGRLAPLTIRDARYYVSSGTNASRTLTIDGFVSPDYGTGYNWKRFARHKMDVWIDVQISGDTGNETAIVEVEYNSSGNWIRIQFVTFDCNYRGSFPMMFRYTTLESWDTLAFRVRTTQNRTEAIRVTIDVANYNESGNAPGSNSGTGGGGGNPPPPPPPGDGGWCVDYETARLPDGRYVRDLRVGDMIACWNDDPAAPAEVMLPVRAIAFGEESCMGLVTVSGAHLIQSISTPMTLRDGSTAYTPGMLGRDVLVRDSRRLTWEPVVELRPVGHRRVVKLNAGDRMYFAGTDPARTLATHNAQKPITLGP